MQQFHHFKQDGFILIITLIFLQIFMLLGLFALQSHLWLNRNSRQFMFKQDMKQAAEYQLQQAEKQLIQSHLYCHIPITAAAILVAKTTSWWQSVSCAGNFQSFQYYYVVESLGDDICADVDQSQSVASYFRITLLMMSKLTSAQHIVLQSTVIKSHAITSLCMGSHHRVMVGRQSSRELVGRL